nr:hypothetical protein [Brevibacterium album]
MTTQAAESARDRIISDVTRHLKDVPDSALEALEHPEQLGEKMVALVPRTPGAYGRIIGPVYSTRALEAMWGMTRAAISQKVRTGKLLALKVKGRSLFPVFQFDGERVRADVIEIVQELEGAVDAFTIAQWMRSPLSEHGGNAVGAARRRKARCCPCCCAAGRCALDSLMRTKPPMSDADRNIIAECLDRRECSARLPKGLSSQPSPLSRCVREPCGTGLTGVRLARGSMPAAGTVDSISAIPMASAILREVLRTLRERSSALTSWGRELCHLRSWRSGRFPFCSCHAR